MIEKLLKFSGFYIDKTEHNIISDMIDELKILSDFKPKYDKTFRKTTDFSSLRCDEIKTSSDITDILSNSKSKNDDGFLVNKII